MYSAHLIFLFLTLSYPCVAEATCQSYSSGGSGGLEPKDNEGAMRLVFLCTGDPYYVLYTALLIS
jgi:hypothetical protein